MYLFRKKHIKYYIDIKKKKNLNENYLLYIINQNIYLYCIYIISVYYLKMLKNFLII